MHDENRASPGQTNLRSRTKWAVILSALLAIVLTLFLAAPALAATGTVLLASANSAGIQGNIGSDFSAISGDGRYVAFSSSATNLVAPATSGRQVFRKDLSTGAVVLVSSTSLGAQGNGNSDMPCLSYDGRYVAFQSASTNFVVPATANTQVFRKDLATGEILLASADSAGAQGNSNSTSPGSLSADGRYVAFYSSATNLVAPATAASQIFRKDLLTAAVALCSSSSDGTAGNNGSIWPRMSADGRYVAFQSQATNLVAPPTTGAQVFRKDLKTAAVILISASAAGIQGDGVSQIPGISPDGGYVAFTSTSTNLVTPASSNQQVFMKNVATGVVTMVSANAAGVQGNNGSRTAR